MRADISTITLLAGKNRAIRAVIFISVVLFLANTGVAAPADVDLLPPGQVRVQILEGIPDQPNWDFAPVEPGEAYTEPAFGFVAVPSKYSSKGIKIDRSAPFVLRASALITLPKGDHRVLLRALTGTRLLVDGRQILGTRFPTVNADGHEGVPETPAAVEPDIRYLRPGHLETLTNYVSDGDSHVFTLEAMIGSKGRRPELGELSVSVASEGKTFQLLSPEATAKVSLTEQGWDSYAAARRIYWKAHDAQSRQIAGAPENKYWNWRHDLARKHLAATIGNQAAPRVSKSMPVQNDIDRFIGARLEAAGVRPGALTDDYAFLRRVTLDIVGTLPTMEQVDAFLGDKSGKRRSAAIDRLLSDPGWADHWVGYWQDVLAENPGILKPMLNNTGPFRWWIRDSFADNKPMDRFATELVMMEGSVYYGGPAGFSMATDNDVPMAQKAQIVAQAFLGMQLQCARCHDAPYHHFKQKDLFSFAAMLKREPQQVPLTSSIPTNSNIIIGRLVNVTLKPGSKIEPAWPFADVVPDELGEGVLRDAHDPREKLAALLTDPRNERFSKVLVNRLWKRYLGWGLVEPVDDWETAKPSHPELLDYLARELVSHDYDLKHVARLILNSHAYQRAVQPAGSQDVPPENRMFASPARRRMAAEQVVDSLFSAVGKPYDSEEMNLDIDCRRPVKEFNNLGRPCRAWEFTSLSNERDRPALAMPRAQEIVDTLASFGWRESRQSAQTVRDHSPNVLQPATLANGLLGNGRITRLSDDNVITALCLEDRPLPELLRSVFLRLLTRPPSAGELAAFTSYLQPGYAGRRTPSSEQLATKAVGPVRAVSWANHLNPEATRIKQEQERQARAGDPASARLRSDWRERMEDVLWALINTPEFVFVP